jgi:hypothetical protein
LSFFDEGDEPRTVITPRQAPRRSPGGRPPVDDRTLLVRRGAAALVVLLVVVLVILGVKAILDRQATAALKSYATEVGGMVTSEQTTVRVPFFTQLDGAYNSSNESEIANSIQQEVQQLQSDYRTAQGWSVPAQMVGAQRWFVGVLGLRLTALTQVENEVQQLLGNGRQAATVKAIAGSMEILAAADVNYAERAKPLILAALQSAGITGVAVPSVAFLPDVAWMIPATVAQRVLGYVPGSLGGSATPGNTAPANGALVGHALESVSVNGTAMTPGTTPNDFTLGPSGVTFTLVVKNGGTEVENGVETKIYFAKAGLDLSCMTSTSTIRQTTPGQTYNSAIVLSPPESSCNSFYGLPLEMTAEVVPVPGEKNTKNNDLSFLVEFARP